MKSFNANEYIKQKYRQIVLKLDRQKDAGIIQHLADQKNITAYVRDLISEDLDHGDKAEQV